MNYDKITALYAAKQVCKRQCCLQPDSIDKVLRTYMLLDHSTGFVHNLNEVFCQGFSFGEGFFSPKNIKAIYLLSSGLFQIPKCKEELKKGHLAKRMADYVETEGRPQDMMSA